MDEHRDERREVVPIRALPPVQLPRATHSGVLHLGQAEIPCYVLNDGTRLILLSGILKALGMPASGTARRGVNRIGDFLAGNRIKPFVSQALEERIGHPRLFITPHGNVAYGGYEATVLGDLCRAILSARRDPKQKLDPRQLRIAAAAELVLDAFVNVGIIALVDEATGYQADRAADELHRLMEVFMNPLYRQWSRTFPREFFEEMFRLRGWRVDFRRGPLGPRHAAQLTDEVVYRRLHPEVLAQLRERNPRVGERRRYKHFQLLSDDLGRPTLEKHRMRVVTLMQVSRTWGEFMEYLDRLCPVPRQRALSPAIAADVAGFRAIAEEEGDVL